MLIWLLNRGEGAQDASRRRFVGEMMGLFWGRRRGRGGFKAFHFSSATRARTDARDCFPFELQKKKPKPLKSLRRAQIRTFEPGPRLRTTRGAGRRLHIFKDRAPRPALKSSR